jgi:hypothetical protein
VWLSNQALSKKSAFSKTIPIFNQILKSIEEILFDFFFFTTTNIDNTN